MRSSKAYIGTVMGIIMYSAFSEVNARFVIKQMECYEQFSMLEHEGYPAFCHFSLICDKTLYRKCS